MGKINFVVQLSRSGATVMAKTLAQPKKWRNTGVIVKRGKYAIASFAVPEIADEAKRAILCVGGCSPKHDLDLCEHTFSSDEDAVEFCKQISWMVEDLGGYVVKGGDLQASKPHPKITDEELRSIERFLPGACYIAKDKDGKVHAYNAKPVLVDLGWALKNNRSSYIRAPFLDERFKDIEPKSLIEIHAGCATKE